MPNVKLTLKKRISIFGGACLVVFFVGVMAWASFGFAKENEDKIDERYDMKKEKSQGNRGNMQALLLKNFTLPFLQNASTSYTAEDMEEADISTSTATSTPPEPEVSPSPETSPTSTTTPPFVAGSTSAGNTILGQGFFASNYYRNTGFSQNTTNMLKLFGLLSGGLGLILLGRGFFGQRRFN